MLITYPIIIRPINLELTRLLTQTLQVDLCLAESVDLTPEKLYLVMVKCIKAQLSSLTQVTPKLN